MRKIYVLFIVSALLSTCCAGCRTANPATEQQDWSVPYAVEESRSPELIQRPDPDTICGGEERVNQEVVDAVNRQLLQLPRWLRQAFLKSGWSMTVVSYDIATVDYASEFEPGTVFGSTSYKAHSIKILNTMRAAANSPLHEMGHWLDSYSQYPTLNDEVYQKIYDAEGEQYRATFGPGCSWDAQEFFAEGFRCYWRSPMLLSKTCPQFYSYLESVLLEAQLTYERSLAV